MTSTVDIAKGATGADSGLSRRSILLSGAVAASVAATGFSASAFAASGSLKVGAGKCAIALALPYGGFATQIDPLYARVLLMDNGSQRIALVSIDVTAVGDATLIADIQQIVGGVVGTASNHVVFYAAHSFSTPHFFTTASAPPGTDLTALAAALVAIGAALTTAAQQALASLVPAKVGSGTGRSKLAVSRDEHSSGGWYLGFDDTGYSDPKFSVMRFDDAAGNVIALLANVAVQPSVLDSVPDANGLPVMSADLAGQVCTRLEAYYGTGVTALFLPGAGGDQAPIFKGTFYIYPPGAGPVFLQTTQDQAVSLLYQIGGRMTADIVRVIDGITTAETTRLSLVNTSVQLTSVTNSLRPTGPILSHTYTLGPAVALPYSLIAIGDTAIVGTAVELSAILGSTIRELSPFRNTLVGTLVGLSAKYIPTLEQYNRFTYEAQEAQYAPGSGEIFVEMVARRLIPFSRNS